MCILDLKGTRIFEMAHLSPKFVYEEFGDLIQYILKNNNSLDKIDRIIEDRMFWVA